MTRRPTNIPYIPKHRQMSRLEPSYRGKFTKGDSGIDALRKTDHDARRVARKGGASILGMLIGIGLVAGGTWLFTSREPTNDPAAETDALVREFVWEEKIRLEEAGPPPPAPPFAGARPPIGNLGGLFSAQDYPAEAIKDEIEGTVQVRLTIREDGSVSQCESVDNDAPNILLRRTCTIIISRARFLPALNSEGEAVEGVFVSPRIRWEIPQG